MRFTAKPKKACEGRVVDTEHRGSDIPRGGIYWRVGRCDKQKLLARTRRIKGQVEALERALENRIECGAVLQQIAAVRGAVNGLMTEVMEGHLREHVADKEAPVGQKELEPVERVIRSYLK